MKKTSIRIFRPDPDQMGYRQRVKSLNLKARKDLNTESRYDRIRIRWDIVESIWVFGSDYNNGRILSLPACTFRHCYFLSKSGAKVQLKEPGISVLNSNANKHRPYIRWQLRNRSARFERNQYLIDIRCKFGMIILVVSHVRNMFWVTIKYKYHGIGLGMFISILTVP